MTNTTRHRGLVGLLIERTVKKYFTVDSVVRLFRTTEVKALKDNK